MKIEARTLLTAQDASASANSLVVDGQGLCGFSIQSIYSGTASGTITVQGSNDWVLPANAQPTNWANIGSAVTIATNQQMIVNYADMYFRWVRVVFTTAAGTGSVTVKFFGKGP